MTPPQSPGLLLPLTALLLGVAVVSGCRCEDRIRSLHDPKKDESTHPVTSNPPPSTGPAWRHDPIRPPGELCIDLDGDGYGVGPGCKGPDCDDGDLLLGADGTRSCYTGPEGTLGVGACAAGLERCVNGALSACEAQVLPSDEVCDAADNDCDGAVDEAVVRTCYDGPANTLGVGVCVAGLQTCTDGAFGECAGEVLPSDELCDTVDNDCDGQADEALARSCYDGPAGTLSVGACAAGLQACAAGAWGTCAGAVLPSAEDCDGVDDDCDGAVDDGVTRACYPGPAGTEGVGLCAAGVQACLSGSWAACGGYTAPATEVCDAKDNNCNGSTDENVSVFSKPGADQDTLPIYRPVDVIFVVDNSGSMTDEIKAIETNINQNFAAIMQQSGLDYRVILLSKHGRASTDQSICITSPLSNNGSCTGSLAACPSNGPRFFHYSVEIGSHDSLYQITHTYNAADSCGRAPNGWSQWLRSDAQKVFIEITDDGPESGNRAKSSDKVTAAAFLSSLYALSPRQFGTPSAPNFVFHSIVGQKENNPVLAPWLPTQALVNSLCTGNGGNVMQNGLEYQKLSVGSGGLRYPICQYQSFDAIFQEVAAGIISGSRLQCGFTVTSIPSDSAIGNTTGEMVPSNGGATVPLTHVANEQACGSAKAFYTVGNDLFLCPSACAVWQQDPTAIVNVLFTCTNQVQP